MAQDRPKMAPRSPKIAPRWPQDGPRWPQDGPRWPQDRPKVAPSWPQDGPRCPEDGYVKLYDDTYGLKLADEAKIHEKPWFFHGFKPRSGAQDGPTVKADLRRRIPRMPSDVGSITACMHFSTESSNFILPCHNIFWLKAYERLAVENSKESRSNLHCPRPERKGIACT